MSKRLTLVLGGARAGKSTYAQQLASRGERVLFVATAEAGDADMEARIAAHRESRPADWDTLEEPLDLVGALEPVADRYDMVLLDCLTLWVSNLLLRDGEDGARDADIPARVNALLETYDRGRPRGSWSATRWDWGWWRLRGWDASTQTSWDGRIRSWRQRPTTCSSWRRVCR